MRRFMFIILCTVLLAACGAPETGAVPTAPAVAPTNPAQSNANDPCGPDALKAYRLQYNSIIDRWSAAALTAGQAKATDLQAPIDSLQKIADELSGLKPPTCAEPGQAESIDAMKMSIGGYQDLLAKKDVGQTIRTSIDKLAQARTKIAALPGTPEPLPTPLPTNTPLATWTPLPTAEPTATPPPTATPQPRQGVIAGRTQMYDAPNSDAPVRTLAKDTAVLVFETQKGRLHIRVDGADGWVSPGSVIIK